MQDVCQVCAKSLTSLMLTSSATAATLSRRSVFFKLAIGSRKPALHLIGAQANHCQALRGPKDEPLSLLELATLRVSPLAIEKHNTRHCAS